MTDDIFPYFLGFEFSKNWIQTLQSERTKEIHTKRLPVLRNNLFLDTNRMNGTIEI